ncbi:MAG: DUF6076 domain-containing protein [Eubacteriales bacterium]
MNENFEAMTIEDEQVAWIEEDSLVIAGEGEDFVTPLSQGIIQFLELEISDFECAIDDFEEEVIDENKMTDSFLSLVNSHVYLQCFCPVILNHSVEDYRAYAHLLSELQVKFLGLVHFCFDQSHLELKDFTASQRLFLLSNTKFNSFPRLFQQEQTVEMKSGGEFTLNDTQTEMEKNLGLPAGYINFVKDQEVVVRKKYILTSTLEALSLEFFTMVEKNYKLKQCKRCFRFFQIKSKRNPDFCDYVAEGSTQTCQQIMAGKNFEERNKNNEPLKIYKKYYKRYHERTKVNTIKRDIFEKWSRDACVKRDLCTDGKLTVEEFENWCHGSFQNRDRKK